MGKNTVFLFLLLSDLVNSQVFMSKRNLSQALIFRDFFQSYEIYTVKLSRYEEITVIHMKFILNSRMLKRYDKITVIIWKILIF